MSLDFFDRTLSEWIAPGIFLGAFILELFFLLFFYFRLLFLKKTTETILEKPLTVCLCVRNEEDRIEHILQQLLTQDYGNYEVVVVDDFSEDCTIQKVGQLAKKYPRLKFTSISQETSFSEKMAINLALKAAHSEWVVFLRPDNELISPLFLKKVNDAITESSFLLNYTNQQAGKGFRNHCCRVERFTAFLSTAAYGLVGHKAFYNDSNVVFHKELYFEQSGFRGKMNAYYANLELVFNDSGKRKVSVLVDPETMIREERTCFPGDFSELVKKRLRINRQLGAGKRFVHFLEDLSKFLLWGAFAWLLITEPMNWLFITIPVVIVLFLQLFVVKTMTTRLNEAKIFLSSFVYMYIRPVLNWYHAGKIYILDKRNKWN
ncbi:glycosyltransferase [Sunxiuqinia elliptica]|uniref:Glycosyltransferase, catalytic subunit of cellulose synthase and poly-beta-1,6-N-acetylglucosamine synthase n=1 Tax=Sunxiuqinia elliptica TaxID=655355 RepID=A0A1I2A902_9BACT|nr:glycosyltransferase [Sunxiuqinia elliptica]SFE40068.1 Glycosyltransferase, catalytic subunit of cellulose synthase and poly-beta-1,6-N-acetylglucosamine synthase [Sunxiuqinia elliptica]